jgi:hypothetical protein
MSDFVDLTQYTYSETSGGKILNVGWLGTTWQYPRGRCEKAVRDRLALLSLNPEAVMRGFHYCEFCDVESPIYLPVPGSTQDAFLGTGEIRVADAGVTYAAPTLILHYIDAHEYLPPTVFREAVMRVPADLL